MNQLVSSPDAAIQQTCAIFRAQGDKIAADLELIRKVWILNEAFAASRLSMMRIMARRTKAATVMA